jgi:hypothetical protein
VNQLDPGAYGSYHGLLLSVQRRLAKNVSALANYTWSHCIDEGEINTDQATAYRIPFNRRADRANCDADRRQIFNLSMVAGTPGSWPGLFGKVAGNWQLSPIVQAQTGGYITVSNSRNSGLFDGAVPVQSADSAVSDRTILGWFNTAAFALNNPGQQGNVGRNNIAGPGTVTVNVALSRRLRLRESQWVELRGEAFNLMNHANFSNPNASVGNTTFGRINSANDPRILQFAVKYLF